MLAYWTMVRRELGGHFISWTGYVIISAVLFLLGLCFVNLLEAMNSEASEQPIMELFYNTYYFWLILLISAPAITMRAFALEKYSGTFETLMTTPVSDLQVVLSKFTGAIIFYLLMWLPLARMRCSSCTVQQRSAVLDPGTLVSTFLGIFLLGGLHVARLFCLGVDAQPNHRGDADLRDGGIAVPAQLSFAHLCQPHRLGSEAFAAPFVDRAHA